MSELILAVIVGFIFGICVFGILTAITLDNERKFELGENVAFKERRSWGTGIVVGYTEDIKYNGFNEYIKPAVIIVSGEVIHTKFEDEVFPIKYVEGEDD